MRPRPLHRLVQRIARAEDGVAATELALATPLLLLLFLGGYDVARYVLINNQVMKTGFSVSDVTSQYDVLTAAAYKQIVKITGENLPDYVSGQNGVTILTSVHLDGATPKVSWQCYSTDGSGWTSKVGGASGAATVPAGLLADAKDNLIVSEVYFRFEPVFMTYFKDNSDLYSQSMFRPRLGALTTKPC